MKKNQQAEGFFFQPTNIRWMLRIFYSLCTLIILADFMVHRHIVTSVEALPGFYGIYGFAACVTLVMVSVKIRQFVMRDKQYYDAVTAIENNKDKEKND